MARCRNVVTRVIDTGDWREYWPDAWDDLQGLVRAHCDEGCDGQPIRMQVACSDITEPPRYRAILEVQR